MPIDTGEITRPLELLLEQMIRAIPGLIAAIVIFLITLYVAHLLSQLLQKTLERRNADHEVTILLARITYWSALVLGIALALQQVGFNLTAFLAGLGIAGFTIGFALQDVSKNFIAGILLLLQQPFQIGEDIEVAGYSGTIEEINVRATTLRTFDGLVVLVPNGDVFTEAITNFTQSDRRRVELNVGVDYHSNPEQVRDTALAAIVDIPGLLEDPAPRVFFNNFGASTIDMTLYFWIDTEKIGTSAAKDAALVFIKAAFEDKSIDMPFPTQTLYLQQAS